MPDLAGGRVISRDREIAHQTLMGRALRAAAGFAALGVAAGDAVALVLRLVDRADGLIEGLS